MNPLANEKNVTQKQPQSANQNDKIAPTVILTPIDAYVHERARSQPKTLEDVEVKFEQTRRTNEHQLTLPKELEPYEKRFAFRWLFKHKKAIDHAVDQRGWTLCNATLFPDLPRHLFASTGCMERGDNVLAFMPLKKAEELRKTPGELSRQIINSTLDKHKNNPDFYVPSDREDKRVIGI